MVAKGSTLNVEGDQSGGVKITGNNSERSGGGVAADNSGFINLSSGSHITANTAKENGGGVYIARSSSLVATASAHDGMITNNTAEGNGGGVYIEGEISIGRIENTISGNTAKQSGGGVYLASGTCNVADATITNNIAELNGGGVYVGGTYNVMGTPNITGNTVGGAPNNVYLPSGKAIAPNLSLTVNAQIGVTTEVKPYKTNGVNITKPQTFKDFSASFKSDSPYYTVSNARQGFVNIVYLSASATNVMLNLNGGTDGSTSYIAYGGETRPEGITLPIKNVDGFAGYYTTASGSGQCVIGADGAYVPNVAGYTDAAGKWIYAAGGNITLHARWGTAAASVTYSGREVRFITFKDAWSNALSHNTTSSARATVKLYRGVAEADYPT